MSQFSNQTMPSIIWETSGRSNWLRYHIHLVSGREDYSDPITSGNVSGKMDKDLSLDLWENFVSGMSAGYPDIADYDANSVRFSTPLLPAPASHYCNPPCTTSNPLLQLFPPP